VCSSDLIIYPNGYESALPCLFPGKDLRIER
jgi:hypothetical protein